MIFSYVSAAAVQSYGVLLKITIMVTVKGSNAKPLEIQLASETVYILT